MSSVVTGEAVVLELRPAGFAARGLGTLIDFAAQLLVVFGLALLLADTLEGAFDPALTGALVLILAVLGAAIGPTLVAVFSTVPLITPLLQDPATGAGETTPGG